MTCDTCKYWVKARYSETLKTCGHPDINMGYQYSASDMKKNSVWIEDDEGWGWYTGPKFGCVNWEAIRRRIYKRG